MEGLFFSKDRFSKFSRMRVTYIIAFAVAFVLTEVGREIYRPFIYQNGINDFGFADVMGNLLGTVAIIFFGLAIYHSTRIQGIRLIALVTIGIVIYELLQPALPRGVLDWKDILSTPFAGTISLMIFLAFWRVIGDPSSEEGKVDS